MTKMHMRILRGVPGIAVGVLVGALMAGTAVMAVTNADRAGTPTVKVCVTKGVVRSADASGKCPSGTKAKKINVKGRRGPVGPIGPGGSTYGTPLSPSPNAQRLRLDGFVADIVCPGNDNVSVDLPVGPFFSVTGSVAYGHGVTGSVEPVSWIANDDLLVPLEFATSLGRIALDTTFLLAQGVGELTLSVSWSPDSNRCLVIATSTRVGRWSVA